MDPERSQDRDYRVKTTRQQMIDAAEMGCNGITINGPDRLMAYVRDLG